MKPALCLLVASLMTSNVHAAPALTPPDAEKHPHTVKAPFGATRSDDYYWLRDDKREDRKMLAYLNAENAYTDQVVAPLKPLEDTLYKEIVARIKQDDASVPSRDRGYWYYTRFETGKDYPIQARRKGSMEAPEEILLDINTMAEGKGYFNVGDADVSQDNHLLAWAEDDVGRRQYVIRFKDLRTGEVLPDRIENVSPNVVWADDNRTLFYVENDPE
ncbi:MAG: S9 family peptidase, partial [Stenotrophomonas bentonitica]